MKTVIVWMLSCCTVVVGGGGESKIERNVGWIYHNRVCCHDKRLNIDWLLPPVKFFSKLNYFISGYFDPINIFLIIKINNLQGDLSSISAKTATLDTTSVCYSMQDARAIRACRPAQDLFSNFNVICFGYSDPETIFLDNENKYFGVILQILGPRKSIDADCHQHSQNNVETWKKWCRRSVWSQTIATVDVPAVSTSASVFIIEYDIFCILWSRKYFLDN